MELGRTGDFCHADFTSNDVQAIDAAGYDDEARLKTAYDLGVEAGQAAKTRYTDGLSGFFYFVDDPNGHLSGRPDVSQLTSVAGTGFRRTVGADLLTCYKQEEEVNHDE